MGERINRAEATKRCNKEFFPRPGLHNERRSRFPNVLGEPIIAAHIAEQFKERGRGDSYGIRERTLEQQPATIHQKVDGLQQYVQFSSPIPTGKHPTREYQVAATSHY